MRSRTCCALTLAILGALSTYPGKAADGWWPYSTQPFLGGSAFSRDGRWVLGGSAGTPAYSLVATGEWVVVGRIPNPATQALWPGGFRAGGSDARGAPVLAGSAIHDCTQFGPCTATAFRWSAATGFVLLPNPIDPLLDTIATDTSADGGIIVGAIQLGRNSPYVNPTPEGVPFPAVLSIPGWEAAIWNASNTLQRLGFLPGGTMSVANGVSADGRVVIGTSTQAYANDTSGAVAFRWTSTGGMVSLGTLAGDHLSYGTDVSDDGNVIVGASRLTYLPPGTCCIPSTRDVAFRWTPGTGMQSLGFLPGLNNSVATAVSGDGRVTVGYGFSVDGVGNVVTNSQLGFRWSATDGMQSVSQWLTDAGVTLPAGLVLYNVSDVDPRGETLLGSGRYDGQTSPFLWIARVGDDGSGLVTDIEQYRRTLGDSAIQLQQSVGSLATVALDGAHRRTLLDRGMTQSVHGCAWGGADVEFVDELGMRRQWFEAGMCRDFGRSRVGLGIGAGHDRSRYGLDSRLRTGHRHVTAEVAMPIGTRWEVDAQATYGEFDVDLLRRYAGASGVDMSAGSGWGRFTTLRTRVFARELWHAGIATLTPYAALTRTDSRLKPFTETRGGFPAHYGDARWASTDASLGLMATLQAGPSTTVTPTLEWSRRLDTSDTPLVADTGGLLGTALTPRGHDDQWTRLSIDVDRRIGDRSNLRLSLSADSRDAASLGLGALYGIGF